MHSYGGLVGTKAAGRGSSVVGKHKVTRSGQAGIKACTADSRSAPNPLAALCKRQQVHRRAGVAKIADVARNSRRGKGLYADKLSLLRVAGGRADDILDRIIADNT